MRRLIGDYDLRFIPSFLAKHESEVGAPAGRPVVRQWCDLPET